MSTTAEITRELIVPEVGVHLNVSAEVYHRQWDAVNKSSLDDIADYSPMHCDYFRRHPSEPTEAMIVGSAFHALVLEPDKYESEFVVSGQCEGILQKGGRCQSGGKILSSDGKWFCGKHDPKELAEPRIITVLTEDQDYKVKAWRDSLLGVREARAFIESPGNNEVSIVWRDADTGVLCKARLDMVREGWSCIGDLKTTECAAEKKYSRTLGDYGYERQAAWYLDAAKSVGLDVSKFAHLCVEKSAPYVPALYCIGTLSVEAGRDQNKKLMLVYANCKETNHWPGYTTGFKDIEISQWRMKEIIQNGF